MDRGISSNVGDLEYCINGLFIIFDCMNISENLRGNCEKGSLIKDPLKFPLWKTLQAPEDGNIKGSTC